MEGRCRGLWEPYLDVGVGGSPPLLLSPVLFLCVLHIVLFVTYALMYQLVTISFHYIFTTINYCTTAQLM